MLKMNANGPAIWGGCVTRRSIRSRSRFFSHKAVTVQGGGACPAVAQRKRGRSFCRPGTNFIEHYACLGTSLIGAGKLSRFRILVGGTGAVSRYNLSRSQKSVTVQNLNCVQMRALPNESAGYRRSWVSGCVNHYKTVLREGALACPAYRQACGRQESKKCDKQLTHIVRVSTRGIL
jgi:hypothetical protein